MTGAADMPAMFRKILVANRGEIACRVIRTARRMGIATVAVYSEADVEAQHVRLADDAVAIGAAPARESYLRPEKIIEAARRTGAEAIHPGYGFLSENADFAQACAAAGIVFIGPPASAIRAMGDKSAAKALMERAGVALAPGYHGAIQEAAFLEAEAERIGYPVLIKASAGGGGKGMRRVDARADFAAALASCQREARAAFGDDRVLVERCLIAPRHIEIQVFGDSHGHLVHLFERDCSVQRRHQKVLEEAPAPGMTPERRARMGAAAVEAAKAVGYVGAGTVEFITDRDGSFYFMEMNTRLQVEHAVTEMITGLDLVEWQLRVAAGEPLPLRQEQLEIDGHAIEARLYAEDPAHGFLPSTGRLIHLSMPVAGAQVRVDSGVVQGDVISSNYDPMIAKLIVHGRDRKGALARLRGALAACRIVGVQSNVEFLARLIATTSFAEADLDTGLIEREHAVLFAAAETPDDVWWIAALAELLRERASAHAQASDAADADSPWRALDGWRLNGPARRTLRFRQGARVVSIDVQGTGPDDGTQPRGYALAIEGKGVTVSGSLDAEGRVRARLADRRVEAVVIAVGERRHVFVDGQSWVLSFGEASPMHASRPSREEAAGGLAAPMSGKVVAVLVAVGATVAPGDALLVLEAMKMEHTVTAPHRGVVKAFRCAAGDQVEGGAELVEFEGETE